ncbi:hypothetical protein FACS1894120_2660 [Clostridia bacterium]|nr:hypothetical protein FACS1894120_2660 [Clostridia bacterium]
MSKGDESIIVTTGDNKGLYKKLSDESNLRYAIPRKVVLLGGNPIQTYSTRYLLSGGEPNNKSPLPSNFVVGGSDDYISIGDICEIVLQYNDSKDGVPATDAFIKTDSVSIAFVSAKTFVEGNIDASDYSAVVIYGYRKKLISADFPRNVYFADKRIHSESANNIYYETTRFEITENSFVQLGVNNERK